MSLEFSFAQKGVIVPKAFLPSYYEGQPHSNPNSHTYGNNYSFMTSWSIYEDIAKGFALENSTAGVVVEIQVKKSEMIVSQASKVFPFDHEGEVQLKGVRKGVPKKVISGS